MPSSSAISPDAKTEAKPNGARPDVRPAASKAVTADDVRRAFESGKYPYRNRMSRRSYEAEKAALQAELLKVQLWAQDTGQKFVMLFEGRDAAGKGGTIKRFTEHLNPRTARVVVRYGEEAMGGDQELRRHFPAAEAIAGCRHLVLGADGGGGGLPAARGRAILGLARAVAEGGICFDGSMDPGTLRTRLLAIPGVGPWTAEYVAMRALGDPDALPAGDLVLRRALAPRGGVPPTAAQVRRRAEAWRPWRSYALMLLWRDAQTRREPLARGGRRTPHGRRKEEASWSSRTSTVRSVPS